MWLLSTPVVLTLVQFLKLKEAQTSKMQVLPSPWEGLHLTKCLAHSERSINSKIVVILINSAQGPFGFCGLGCQGWFTWRPTERAWPGREEARRAGGLGKGPALQAPHGQSILKALYLKNKPIK